MHFACILKNAKKVLVVPSKWVHKLNVVELINNGLNTQQIYLVFFSTNEEVEADFNAPILADYVDDVNATYEVFILRFFGKLSTFLAFHFSQNLMFKFSTRFES